MNFCPDCESYLTTKITNNDNPNKLINLECRNCGYVKNIDISKEPQYKCVYQVNYNIKKIKIDQKNIQYLDKDPTLPHVDNIPCPNTQCVTNKETINPEVLVGDTKPQNDILYIKLNETDLTFLYQCCNCKHTWTNK
jgi:DNA-directed RNA polymerase subunit M/transcription elongation factor TFIIS